jgi:oligopeptide transport system ATP-binding protein
VAMETKRPLLDVSDLRTQFFTQDGVVKAVNGVGFWLAEGEALGLVGESGCGKSVTALSLMRLIPQPPGRVVAGEATFAGRDLLKMRKRELRELRGGDVAMIFQDPMTSLNPVLTIGDQIGEAIQVHNPDVKDDAAEKRVVDLLALVGVPNPAQRVKQYPHEFSGGMRQRAMIAMALSLNPDVLIADEPTTALDVTVQAQILDLIDRLKSEFNAAVVIITHDLGVVAEHCDNIMVMYAGKAAEFGDTDDIYYKPLHPYTWGLLSSIPRLDEEQQERLNPIRGLPPSLIQVPPGCAFHPRCPYRFDPCDRDVPELLPVDGHHAASCHLSLADKERIRDQEILVRR